jgi:single-stranded DNA-binding protein
MFLGTIVDARVVSETAFTRQAGTSKVTKIRVADNPSRKSDRTPARFVNAEAWGTMGEQLAKLSKGDVVSLTGELKLDKYTDKKGVERTDDVLVVTQFRVQKSESFYVKGPAADPGSKVEDEEAESDLPF